jgi:hypothetical protein
MHLVVVVTVCVVVGGKPCPPPQAQQASLAVMLKFEPASANNPHLSVLSRYQSQSKFGPNKSYHLSSPSGSMSPQ